MQSNYMESIVLSHLRLRGVPLIALEAFHSLLSSNSTQHPSPRSQGESKLTKIAL